MRVCDILTSLSWTFTFAIHTLQLLKAASKMMTVQCQITTLSGSFYAIEARSLNDLYSQVQGRNGTRAAQLEPRFLFGLVAMPYNVLFNYAS